jgi:hypothetical protein
MIYIDTTSKFFDCNVCGQSYHGDFVEDIKGHEKHHKAFLEARKKHPYLIPYHVGRKMKYEANMMLKDSDIVEAAGVEACESILMAYFSDSLQLSRYSGKHVMWDDFVAMFLYANPARFPERFTKLLVERYGIKAGIEKGKSYYRAPNRKKAKLELDR